VPYNEVFCALLKGHVMKTHDYRHKWPVSGPGRFISSGKAIGNNLIGGCVGPRAVLDAVAKERIPIPVGNRTPLFTK